MCSKSKFKGRVIIFENVKIFSNYKFCVSQGFVLEPILLKVYINNCKYSFRGCGDTVQYADSTQKLLNDFSFIWRHPQTGTIS